MLIINTTGEIIHKIVGLHACGRITLRNRRRIKETRFTHSKRIPKGNKDWTFIKYLVALKYANEKETYEQVARTYISRFPIDSLLNLEIWNIMKAYCKRSIQSRISFHGGTYKRPEQRV